MAAPVSYLTILVAAVAIYLIWMDVGMYLELQRTPPKNFAKNGQNTTDKFTFSPFKPVTVKLLMLSSFIQFIDEPLAYFATTYSHMSRVLSPNTVSYLGVVVALISARFLSSESYFRRQIGILLFKVRDFIDGLDGNIAREIREQQFKGHIPLPNTAGWMIDGICDGIAEVIRFLALVVYLQKLWSNAKQNGASYHLLEGKLPTNNSPRIACASEKLYNNSFTRYVYYIWLKYRVAWKAVAWVGFQSLLSAVLWNYFIVHYHNLLETDQMATSREAKHLESLAVAQNNILKSSSMWMICYFWRLLNPQNIEQIQLLVILYSKETELITIMKVFGYVPIALLGICSYVHLCYASSIISSVAMIS